MKTFLKKSLIDFNQTVLPIDQQAKLKGGEDGDSEVIIVEEIVNG